MSRQFKVGDKIKLKELGNMKRTRRMYSDNSDMLSLIEIDNIYTVQYVESKKIELEENSHMWHPDDFKLHPLRNIIGGRIL